MGLGVGAAVAYTTSTIGATDGASTDCVSGGVDAGNGGVVVGNGVVIGAESAHTDWSKRVVPLHVILTVDVAGHAICEAEQKGG